MCPRRLGPDGVARKLLDAHRNRAPIETAGILPLEDAYTAQERLVELLQDALGCRPIGWKVGLTSLASQELFGAGGPVYGRLLGDPLSPEDGVVRLTELIAPRLECELAFFLGGDLRGPEVRPEDVLLSTAWIAPAFEIVDSRIRDWKVKLGDLVADNACVAGAVVGAACPVPDRDLALVRVVLHKGGSPCAAGTGSEVLGHPARSVAWLANELYRSGRHLASGELVLTGSLSPPVPVASGDRFQADFDDLGSVSVQFS